MSVAVLNASPSAPSWGRAVALLSATTLALLSGLLFTTQSGAVAAYDTGSGFKLPSSMQGDFTNGGSRLEAGDGTQAWVGTKQQALVTLKLKQGVTANSDQPPPAPPSTNGLHPNSLRAYAITGPTTTASGGTSQADDYRAASATSYQVYGDVYCDGVHVAFYAYTAAGQTTVIQVHRPGSTSTCAASADTIEVRWGKLRPDWSGVYPGVTSPDGIVKSRWKASDGTAFPAGGGATPDPSRTGTPYARCANLSGDEINVYGTPITYKESEATGIVGTPAPSFTLPTCPASHPVRMGWGVQGPSGPLASITAPPMPASFNACADYACEVVNAPTTAAQDCHQIGADNVVTTTPGGPCPAGPSGYCMFGPYSLPPAECTGAPAPEPVEQDPGCTPDGLSNLNPFAWMGSIPCLFKYLFIPDGDAWGDAGASIGAAWDGTAPAVVLGEGNKVFAPVVALKDVTAGNCQGPPFAFPSLAGVTEPFTIHPLSTCNELATYLLGIYMPLATAMTYLGGFFSGTRLLLKSAGAESPVKDA